MIDCARFCEACDEWTLPLPNGTCGFCLALLEPQLTHGTRSTYQSGCRCRQCVFVNAEYHREQRRRARSA